MTARKATAQKIMVVGVDGMDPKLTRKYVDQGLMPNVKKLIELGSAREDLHMLGAQPTVTPPMWTTLATGAYPMTHGITGGLGVKEGEPDVAVYNLTSERCMAEQLWNVTAEAGKKTLVWAWPGSSWPPSSDSPNLHVVDGAQPMSPNTGVAQKEFDIVFIATTEVNAPIFRAKAATDDNQACLIKNMEVEDDDKGNILALAAATEIKNYVLKIEDGEMSISKTPFDMALSPINDATGWASAPADAKEMTFLFCEGKLRRVCLILKNEQGVYDRVAMYKSKKDTEPIVVLENDVFTRDVVDDIIWNDEKLNCNRHMRLLSIKPDGSEVKIWASGSMEIDNDKLWHPHYLHKAVVENVGYPQPIPVLGGSNEKLIDCSAKCWDALADWNADALNYLIKREGYEMVFSQLHNCDAQGHMLVQYMKQKGRSELPEETYAKLIQDMYVQTDIYVGKFMHLLDEGWTLLLISDHAQVCPEYEPLLMGDATGVNGGVMEELGLTNFKRDANGNKLYEIDWENTIAVLNAGNHIYVNLKGRDKYGIVDPKDKYEVEEEIMTRIYGYKHPETGKRIAALCLRNKDAALLGIGGPNGGDIIYFNAEGYNFDHADSLSTTEGYGDTSVGPIFIAAGPGFKKGFKTDRVIREVDVAPTMAVLAGVRMPAQCEGAPVYQILSEEY